MRILPPGAISGRSSPARPGSEFTDTKASVLSAGAPLGTFVGKQRICDKRRSAGRQVRAGGAPAAVNAAGWMQVVAESPGRVKRDAPAKGRPRLSLSVLFPMPRRTVWTGHFAFAET